ncbi:MAG: 4-hydroxyphenylacetate 3-hydroxylase N-terminal domain-containing protein [Deinococcales bacterium]
MSNPTNHTLKHNLPDGQAFLASLDDGREIWFDGEKVKQVSEHKAFRNAARNIAKLYDSYHDPVLGDVLLKEDKFGIVTHKFFAPSYNSQELLEARSAIATWQRMSYGWMGRTPEYKAAFMAQLAEGHDFYQPFGDNALNWYKKYASQSLFLNHVLIDPPVDRAKARIDVRDTYISLDQEDDKGIYVSGAKMVATGSILTHATFVGINSGTATRMQTGRDEDMALIFLIDMNSPGLKLICRPSYEFNAPSPFDAPLASRFDENDAVMIFDKAFIPWENVLIYRDVEKTKAFYAASGFFNRYNLQSAVRLVTKLEFCIGLLLKGTEASGTAEFRGVQAKIGELIALKDTLWGLTTAMVYDTEASVGTTVVPKLKLAAAARLLGTNTWHQVRDIFETILAGAPIYTVSSYKDLKVLELESSIEAYYRGTNLAAHERIKLFKLIWDALYSEFAGRHSLYERNYSGNQDQQRIDVLQWSNQRGDSAACRELVDACLADYDLDGWCEGAF